MTQSLSTQPRFNQAIIINFITIVMKLIAGLNLDRVESQSSYMYAKL